MLRASHGKDLSSSKWCKPKCALGESGKGRVLSFNKVCSLTSTTLQGQLLSNFYRSAKHFLTNFKCCLKVKPENAGNYICLGKDQYAQGMSVVQIIVKEKRGNVILIHIGLTDITKK